jgi:hypothetical protein
MVTVSVILSGLVMTVAHTADLVTASAMDVMALMRLPVDTVSPTLTGTLLENANVMIAGKAKTVLIGMEPVTTNVRMSNVLDPLLETVRFVSTTLAGISTDTAFVITTGLALAAPPMLDLVMRDVLAVMAQATTNVLTVPLTLSSMPVRVSAKMFGK